MDAAEVDGRGIDEACGAKLIIPTISMALLALGDADGGVALEVPGVEPPADWHT